MTLRVDLAGSSFRRLRLLQKAAAREQGRELLRIERKLEDLADLLDSTAGDLVRVRHEVAELQKASKAAHEP